MIQTIVGLRVDVLAAFLLMVLPVMAQQSDKPTTDTEAPKAEGGVAMRNLLFRPDQLPKGCAILEQEPGSVPQFGIKKFPHLSSNRKFVDSFAAVIFGGLPVRTDDIVEALLSVYRSTAVSNEFSVLAFRFRTEGTAKAAQIEVRKRHKEVNLSVYRAKDVLVLVNHDALNDPAAPHIKALVTHILSEYGKQKQGNQPSKDQPTANTSADAAKAIRSLIPAAAGMREAEMATVDKIAATQTAPKPDAFGNKPLSVMVMIYKIHPPGLYKAQAEDFCFEAPSVSAEGLFEEIRRSRDSDYYSMIQPDRITDFTCKVDGDRARGVVSFKVPHLYEGKVHYVAERAEDQWEIKEFHLPAHGWKFVRTEGGKWKWFGILGDLSDVDRWPKQSVSCNITLDGKPLAEGTIQFFHTMDVCVMFLGFHGNDGNFHAKLPVGSYHVVVHHSEPEVPEKYRTPGRSGLMIEVKEGENRLGFDLVTDKASP
jgi:hypothetical protein